jgi:hypothetical protein
MVVNLQELLDAFEFVSAGDEGEGEAFISLQSGEIFWRGDYEDSENPPPEDLDDPEQYLAVPHEYELDLGNALPIRFAEEVAPDLVQQVQDCFSRMGAYSHFKALLEPQGLLQRWYEYEEQAKESALREWCADNDIQLAS